MTSGLLVIHAPSGKSKFPRFPYEIREELPVIGQGIFVVETDGVPGKSP
jgi:hypothetical protein